MFSNDKFKFYLFVFLVFSVLSSKHILIYNEETLVTLSFFSFLFFILHFFGNTLQETLQERSQLIGQELQNFVDLKTKSFQQLGNLHQQVSKLLGTSNSLKNSLKNQLNSPIDHEKILKNKFYSQIQNQKQNLGFSESTKRDILTFKFYQVETSLLDFLLFLSKKGKQDTTLKIMKRKAITNGLKGLHHKMMGHF
jgi:hypothetical protein